MMHLRLNKEAAADISKFAGSISSKENSFFNLTKFVLVVSILLAIIMVALR